MVASQYHISETVNTNQPPLLSSGLILFASSQLRVNDPEQSKAESWTVPGDSLLSERGFPGAPGCRHRTETLCTIDGPCTLLFLSPWLGVSPPLSHCAFGLAFPLAAFGTGIFIEKLERRRHIPYPPGAQSNKGSKSRGLHWTNFWPAPSICLNRVKCFAYVIASSLPPPPQKRVR